MLLCIAGSQDEEQWESVCTEGVEQVGDVEETTGIHSLSLSLSLSLFLSLSLYTHTRTHTHTHIQVHLKFRVGYTHSLDHILYAVKANTPQHAIEQT